MGESLQKMLQWCGTVADYDRVPEILSLFIDITKPRSKENIALLLRYLKLVNTAIAQDPLYRALKEGKISWWLQYEKEIVDKMNDLDTHYQDWRKESLQEIIDTMKSNTIKTDSAENFQKKNFIASIITKYILSQESNANILYPAQYARIATDKDKRILKTIYIWWEVDLYFILFLQSDLYSLELMPVKFAVQENLRPPVVDLKIDAAYINHKIPL